jgi:hypothetical protein
MLQRRAPPLQIALGQGPDSTAALIEDAEFVYLVL